MVCSDPIHRVMHARSARAWKPVPNEATRVLHEATRVLHSVCQMIVTYYFWIGIALFAIFIVWVSIAALIEEGLSGVVNLDFLTRTLLWFGASFFCWPFFFTGLAILWIKEHGSKESR